jgi:hypothetical protein
MLRKWREPFTYSVGEICGNHSEIAAGGNENTTCTGAI